MRPRTEASHHRQSDGLPEDHPLREEDDRHLLKTVMLSGTFSCLSLLGEKIINVKTTDLSLAMLTGVSGLLKYETRVLIIRSAQV